MANNAKALAYYEEGSTALDCNVYLVDPYCALQRGANKNTNGLLRQYWQKSTDFKLMKDIEVTLNLLQLNNRLRKTLEFKTPAEMMGKHMPELAA